MNLEAEIEQLKYRISKLENNEEANKEMLRSLIEVTSAVSSMQKSQDNMSGKIDKIDNRLTCIELEPAKKYKALSYEILKYIMIFILGGVLAFFIKF